MFLFSCKVTKQCFVQALNLFTHSINFGELINIDFQFGNQSCLNFEHEFIYMRLSQKVALLDLPHFKGQYFSLQFLLVLKNWSHCEVNRAKRYIRQLQVSRAKDDRDREKISPRLHCSSTLKMRLCSGPVGKHCSA